MKQLIRHILREHTREIEEGIYIKVGKKWTDDKLRDEALKYSTITDFRKENTSAYETARRKGIDFFNDVTSHMTGKREFIQWDEESIRNEALKYSKLKDFREKNNKAYQQAYNSGKDFFYSVTSHMDRPIKYTDDELKQEALKFKTKKEFKNNNPNGYRQALNRGKEFYDNITFHMEYLGNLTERMIYAFLFENKVIYIGLTYNIGVREKQHLQLDDKYKRSKSSVRDYIKLTGETPKMIKLTDYLPYKEAQRKEEEFVQKFSDEGYTILNKAKTGNLGAGIVRWTKDKLRNDALKYNKLVDWEKNNRSAVQSARNLGKEFYDDITSHMSKKIINKYTEEELGNIAKKYSRLSDFVKNDNNAWQQGYHKGEEFYNKLTSHMEKDRKKRKKLSDNDLEILAKKFSNLSDFTTTEYGPYQQSIRRGKEFFNKITSHMERKK